ncbi:MAG TPA: hypothetical protein VFX01_07885 [Methylophilaceae bacterium]|nr:hypothetical protein [Methylophilaceae bacterium]
MKILLAGCMLLFASAAVAAEGYVSGVGSKTCGELVDAVSKKDLSQQNVLDWTQGYFSGSNVAYGLRSRSGDVTTGSSILPSRLMTLVQAKCDAHPDYLLSRAVNEVYFELRQAGQ